MMINWDKVNKLSLEEKIRLFSRPLGCKLPERKDEWQEPVSCYATPNLEDAIMCGDWGF